MQSTGRLYFCQRCHTQVIICSRCDRGQRYCDSTCAKNARSTSLKCAAKKYQSSRSGRFNNAARQRRFRQRQTQKVTHQGSPSSALRDLLKNKPKRPRIAQKLMPVDSSLICHHCGSACQSFLRQDFLQRYQPRHSFRRQSVTGMAKN
ncbi:MAG: hypothetical protein MRK00_11310 [Nitrosomonas sp.]|nr:hypothetical protein [Nitrosomonas sp.]